MVSDSRLFQNVVAQLPNPNSFVKDAYDLAFPQVLAFMSAVIGVLTVSLILKAVTKG